MPTVRATAADLAAWEAKGLIPAPVPGREVRTKRSKYGARAVVVDGVRFDSVKEARRWGELRTMEAAGLIADLERQARFDLHAIGPDGEPVKVCEYRCDFAYVENGKRVVEDVKGLRLPMYMLKRKWMLAELGIRIREVGVE